jgi:hypothetical protein
MNWIVTKPFSTKIRNEHMVFHPGDTMDLTKEKATKLILAGVINSTGLDEMAHEYSTLLRRFWEIDEDPAATMDESRRLVIRLDELYRALHQAGRRVPVRLPVERTKREAQRKLAL